MAVPGSGRKTKVESGGLGVHKRGDGLGTGPVGRADGYQGRKDAAKGGSGGGSNGGGGPKRAGGGGGKSPLMLIIIIAIALLGGGGGLGGLLGGGDSGSTGTGSTGYSNNGGTTSNTTGNTTGNTSGNSGYNTVDYGSSNYSGYYEEGTSGGGILSGLEALLGSGLSSSAAGVTSGWSIETGNTGVLNTKVAAGARDKFYDTASAKNVTVMIYMCGTDLESKSGMATSDLQEMAKATISSNLNIIVYTGGCARWQNSSISSTKNQIWQVQNGGIKKILDDSARVMTDPNTLAAFIQWCGENYPADRNELILWDHGGGSVSGYGYDEKNARSGSMDLSEIRIALQKGGMKFDFIGFDACLMATAENAIALADYADYLLASEETEPGTGWYYTNWVTALSRNPAISTPELGKQIIDDFVDVSARTCRGQSTTLSLVDLAELSETFPKAFAAFAKATSAQIKGTEFKTVSNARNGGREFAQSSRIDQVDLTDMAIRLGTDEGEKLCDTVLSAVKYNRTSIDMTNAYGLSIYFPNKSMSQLGTMVNTYNKLGLDSNYVKCIEQYASVSSSGQGVYGGNGTESGSWSMLSGGGSQSSYQSSGSQSGGLDSSMMMDILSQLLSDRAIPAAGLDRSNTDFFDDSEMTNEELAEILVQNQLDGSLLTFIDAKDSEGNAVHTITLPKEQWELINNIQVNVFYDDGEGYVDMGLDNRYNIQDGVLTGDTDGTWISINKQPVAFYCEGTTVDGDDFATTGRVPCLLNGERANLIIVFDQEHPEGYVAGARRDYVDGETDTIAKSETEIKDGDKIDFLCDYYTYDGDYQDSYMLGEQQTVSGELSISNTAIADGNCLVTYVFTDVYGQEYWTNAIQE